MPFAVDTACNLNSDDMASLRCIADPVKQFCQCIGSILLPLFRGDADTHTIFLVTVDQPLIIAVIDIRNITDTVNTQLLGIVTHPPIRCVDVQTQKHRGMRIRFDDRRQIADQKIGTVRFMLMPAFAEIDIG